LSRNPSIWTQLLPNHLRRNLRDQKANPVHILRIIIIIRRELQVIQEIVRHSVAQIPSIDIQCEKHNQDPEKYPQVRLAPDRVLLSICPSLGDVELLGILVVCTWYVKLC
jgi:hypothetical protein